MKRFLEFLQQLFDSIFPAPKKETEKKEETKKPEKPKKPESEFFTGMVPSPEDDRDYKFFTYNKQKELPGKFERRVPHLKDQGSLGSCVGFSSSYVKDEQERHNHPGRNYETSPLFIYAECKEIDGIPDQQGTYLRTANTVVRNLGVCLEQIFPYSDDVNIRPRPQKAYENAEEFKIKMYTRLDNLKEIKQSIVDHGCVNAGVMVLSNFLDPEIDKDTREAFIPMPNRFILGGHAIAIIGYDDNLTYTYEDGTTYTGFVKMVNSWYRGNEDRWWGKDGTAWIPYDIMYRDISRDTPGFRLFVEAWGWQDEVTPVEPVKELRMIVGETKAHADGMPITLEQAPVIDRDSWRTLTPLRQTCELFGLDVKWDATTQRITIDNRIVMHIGSATVYVDGVLQALQQPPVIDRESWRTLIPLRFISEIIGYDVGWNPEKEEVTITRR